MTSLGFSWIKGHSNTMGFQADTHPCSEAIKAQPMSTLLLIILIDAVWGYLQDCFLGLGKGKDDFRAVWTNTKALKQYF